MLHVHILLVAPLGAGHMAQAGADQHKGRVTIREAAHHTGAAADLPVQSLNHIIGADASPVLAGKISVGQCLFNAVLHFLGSLFQFHGAKFFHHSFRFLPSGFFALLGMDRFEHLCHQLHLGARCH